ncbi:MAG: carboxypeptidase-like regulatory domain-containing protein [Ferruginibacter sp.]
MAAVPATAQLTVSGTVYDSTKIIPVPNVLVKSGIGTQATTDSTGRYEIVTTDKDSLTFIYNNKPTAKFAVRQIPNIGSFDISLHIRINERFKTMKEVKVYSKNYQQDSIENRQYYRKIFGFEKPGVSSSINPGTGSVGLDLDEFINIFRFRRNKQLRKMQNRLLEQEQENYIKYRFNKAAVKRITRLEGTELDRFMTLYKPDFEFTQMATTVEFYQYILTASYQYKKDLLIRNNKTDNP